MKGMIGKIFGNEMVRYLFFGGCTTLVNLAVFYCLRRGCLLPLKVSNFTAIVTAMVFAFFVNKWCVFRAGEGGLKRGVREFVSFIGMRCITLVLEYVGVIVLAGLLSSEMVSKILMQVIVIVLNYLFSRFLVFGHKKITGGVERG